MSFEKDSSKILVQAFVMNYLGEKVERYMKKT